jgi:hypothetical protein
MTKSAVEKADIVASADDDACASTPTIETVLDVSLCGVVHTSCFAGTDGVETETNVEAEVEAAIGVAVSTDLSPSTIFLKAAVYSIKTSTNSSQTPADMSPEPSRP